MSIDPSTEAWELQLRLVHGHAINTLLDGEELRTYGYELVEVVGLAQVLWRKGGRLFTTEAALTEARTTITGEKEDQ